MEDTVDGEYQNYKANDGAFVRKYFFGKHPKLLEMVSRLTDEDIWRLNRGGHDPHKIYAAYHRAVNHKDQPTVILAKTIKGYGMGRIAEGRMTAHQQKKMDMESIKVFRDRFNVPVPDDKIEDLPFYIPPPDAPEMKYLHERRQALGGYLPQRRRKADVVPQVPPLEAFEQVLKGQEREISTTMAFVRVLTALVRDKNIGKFVVPIVPDEARTFGMEGMFRQLGIYSSEGQKYTPQDKDQVMYYREDKAGQILEEGINEAGAFSSWIAAATSYSVSNVLTVPFYIFYSMFGLQRIGDLAWAAGDQRARGFLLGGTAGRTTLNGEGLQHEDGHSHVLSSVIPNCVSYDPTFAYEVGVIIHDGLRRMVTNQEDVFYYVTVMNENYVHPAMTEAADKDVQAGILKGMYLLKEGVQGKAKQRDKPCAADGLGHDPARGDRRGRVAREGLGRRRRHLELPELHRAAPRGPRRRPLEPAAPGREAAEVVRREPPRRARRTGHRLHRLHEGVRRPDPAVHAARQNLPRARHRRVRAVRHAREAALLLRGQPLLGDGGGAQGARRRRRGEARGAWPTRSRNTASIPTSRIR